MQYLPKLKLFFVPGPTFFLLEGYLESFPTLIFGFFCVADLAMIRVKKGMQTQLILHNNDLEHNVDSEREKKLENIKKKKRQRKEIGLNGDFKEGKSVC